MAYYAVQGRAAPAAAASLDLVLLPFTCSESAADDVVLRERTEI